MPNGMYGGVRGGLNSPYSIMSPLRRGFADALADIRHSIFEAFTPALVLHPVRNNTGWNTAGFKKFY